MDRTGLGIRRSPTASGLIEGFTDAHRRLGLDGLLSRTGRRGRWGRPPAPEAHRGFRWALADRWDRTWWPQGIDVAPDASILIVSWFAQERRGVRHGSRITVVDLRGRIPRYQHVLLVRLTSSDDGRLRMEPVRIHAGGLTWDGDRLLVAATRGGLREFHLSDITEVDATEAVHGYRVVLPQSAALVATTEVGEELRYSFVSRARARDGAGDAADDHLVIGEYSPGKGTARLARLALGADSATRDARDLAVVTDVFETSIPRMQGALHIGDTWLVGTSEGPRNHGDLWVGELGALVRHRGALAPGPEDLAVSVDTGELWNLSEFPGRRWVYSLHLSGWLDSEDPEGIRR